MDFNFANSQAAQDVRDRAKQGSLFRDPQNPISYAINAVIQHVSEIMISANRSVSQYQQFGYKVIKDEITGGLGPLAGIYSGLLNCETEYLISIPCDTPFLPDNLVTNLTNHVHE